MVEFDYEIKDENGIHARPAGVIVTEAKKHESGIMLFLGERSADCKRLFSVMGLGAVKGDTVRVRVSGEDEKAAADAVEDAMKNAGL